MKNRLKVNEELIIEVKRKRKITLFFLLEGESRKILFSGKENDVVSYDVAYNENFVIVYNKIENSFLNVVAAYSVKAKKTLSLLNYNLKKALEYMFLSKKSFELEEVLVAINKNDLGYYRNDVSLVKYLTVGNPLVNKEQVVQYILNEYPKLSKYTDLPSGYFSLERANAEMSTIVDDLTRGLLEFNVMPLKLEQLKMPIDVSYCGYRNA